MIRVNLLLSVTTLMAALGAVVVGIFGMNLKSNVVTRKLALSR